jgi:hypothetical protein
LNRLFSSLRIESTIDCGSGRMAPRPHIFMMVSVPTLEVRMITVFLKSMLRPSASSRSPLSNTWKNSSITSGCAFSTSSSSTTL